MRKLLLATVVATTALAGCSAISESRFNPLNWFGKSEPVATQAGTAGPVVLRSLAPRKGFPEFVDTRPLAPNVAELRVSRSASGAIVTATTNLPSLGYYDAQLVPVEDGNPATLSFDFRLRPPTEAAPIGSDAQRRLTAAYSLSFAELANVRTIIVRSESGARQTRR